MPCRNPSHSQQVLADFHRHGWVHLRGAFVERPSTRCSRASAGETPGLGGHLPCLPAASPLVPPRERLARRYLRDLHAPGDAEVREGRFMHRVEDVPGVPLQVVEAVGGAGDVFLLHPLLLHVAAPNAAKEPRFMTSGGVTTDIWGSRLDHAAAV